MPIYEYKREDGTTFDHIERMNDTRLTVCPTTGQKVHRLFGGQSIRTTDTLRARVKQMEKNNHEQNFYTTAEKYKDKVEQFKDENKIPTYKSEHQKITVVNK